MAIILSPYMGPYQTNRSKIEAGLRLGGIYIFCWGKEFFAQYELYIEIQSNFTTLRSNIATENALQMKVLIGKFSINVGFSIATFDYQRVRSPYSPSSTPNKSPKTPKQTAERKPMSAMVTLILDDSTAKEFGRTALAVMDGRGLSDPI